jgi:hypothetical protein
MTSPLPTQQPKPGSLESRNLDGAGLFQFAGAPNGTELNSFESFIQKNDPKDQQEKELEESEAAKKRKRAADTASVAAPPQTLAQSDLFEIAAPSFEGSPTKQTPQDSVDTSEQSELGRPNDVKADTPNTSTQSLKQKETQKEVAEATNEATEQINVEITQEKTEADTTYSNLLDTAKKNADGMENATNEDEMISLAPFDEMQGSANPNMVPDSAITSVSRLASVASIDRTAVTSVSGSNSESETNFSQLASGNPSALIPAEARSKSASPTANATALFKSLPPELEKFKQSGQSQLQLDIPVGENESVRIRLNLRAGEIRSTFITESPELREALQKAWPDFTATHRTQNIQFGESNFQDGLSRQNDTAFQQQNRHPYQSDSDLTTLTTRTPSANPKQTASIQQAPSDTIREGKLNLWA